MIIKKNICSGNIDEIPYQFTESDGSQNMEMFSHKYETESHNPPMAPLLNRLVCRISSLY